MNEKYVMMDLDDSKMKHLAEVLGNPSCKKILNLLADGDLSESDIAGELGMPLNTADYNIKKLVSAGLIEQASHWWSVRGKKIPTYKLSNKKIIISPRTSKFKSIVPAVLLTGAASVLLRYYLIAQENAVFVKDKAMEAVPTMASSASTGSASTGNVVASVISSNWLWFLVGGLVALIIFVTLNWRKI